MLIEQPQAVNAGPYVPQPQMTQPNVNPVHTPHPPHTPHQEHIKPAPDNFSSEPNMNINAGDEKVTKVSVVLDNEALQIIQDASAVNHEAIVNLGIKLFAKTNVYKEFMLKECNKPMDTKTEDIASQVEAKADVSSSSAGAPPVAHSNQASSAPASTGTASGFTSW